MEGEKFHRERYISSGSGFALIASLELRFLEFRRASAIVSAPPELHPTPHRAGWTRGYISERVLFRGEIHARVLSHGMLDRSKPLFSPLVARSHPPSLPFALVFPRYYARREENEGEDDFLSNWLRYWNQCSRRR